MKYAVVIEKGRESYGAHAPALPGCIGAGASRDEVVKQMQEVIEMHLESLRENGEMPPRPSSTLEIIEVAA